ncbi:DUF317 domain-containing protein [Streptomyces uncialis]|uniref:DUF317 domain-containing protein n=1 Tax=Streptomyces uncialis TaxID=1048205 RepID=UPI0038631A39
MITKAPEKGPGSWLVTTLEKRNGVPLWRAWFSRHTPPRLVTAFTRALGDPAPLVQDPWACRPTSAACRGGVRSRRRRWPTRRSTASSS